MYILEPVAHNTIWGGTKLSGYIPGNSGQVGHLYLVNGHKEMSNVIADGPYRGKNLWEVFAEKKRDWGMEAYDEFPLTIALVDAAEHLSIQVHPDDAAAERLEHKRIGKTESWLFLDAPESGWIYAGCRCKTKEDVEKAVAEEKMEGATGRLEIRENDYVCIEAGTLHAITSGSLVYEIEYGSDYTYRFYDYNRKDREGNSRELHIHKAVQAVRPEIMPKVKQFSEDIWFSEKYYEICRKRNICGYKNMSRTLECISVMDGSGDCNGYAIRGGRSILLLPGEELKDAIIYDAFIARLKKTDGKTG